ncbi:hypothetical protein [Kribbella amoyensis]|uniref:hypothetical protein n=1 Tax=Kribbella amoyensis TaxID=996641 RepID=UPI00192D2891|nr:hypothetical protein [Kribbella amoyensis]
MTITPKHRGAYMHWTDWDLELDGEPITVPDRYYTAPPGIPVGPAARIAALYQEFAHALEEKRRARPDFFDALRLHNLLAATQRSAATGTAEVLLSEDPVRTRPAS